MMNWWAVLVSGVAFTVLGAVWYASGLFGRIWMKGIGKTKDQVEVDFSIVNIVGALVGALVASYGVQRLMLWTGKLDVSGGIIIGLMAGICFVAASFFMNDIMEKRPSSLTLVNILFNLVGFVMVGVITGAWR